MYRFAAKVRSERLTLLEEKTDRAFTRPFKDETLRPPPQWTPTSEIIDHGLLLKKAGSPLFTDTINLYEDILSDNGVSFMRARVFVGKTFWFAYLRCFVRVNGVVARVIDTRYTYRSGDDAIHREVFWKEGKLRIESAISVHAAGDSIAARTLPEVRPTERHRLILSSSSKQSFIRGSIAWKFQFESSCEHLVSCGGILYAIVSWGRELVAFEPRASCEVMWRKTLSSDEANVISLAASHNAGMLALGDECGAVKILRADSGEAVASFRVRPVEEQGSRETPRNVDIWVEQLCWSPDGCHIAAAAGRIVTVARASDGLLKLGSKFMEGSITGIKFLGNNTVVCGTYGCVRLLHMINGETNECLERSAAAIMSIAVSDDGLQIAAACLDKVLRVWTREVAEGGGRKMQRVSIGLDLEQE